MLKVVNLSTVANKINRPFAVVSLVNIGDLALSVYVCQGQMNWHKHVDEDELFLVHEGVIELETERGKLTLHSGELAVVPKGTAHRSGSSLRSVVILIRSAVLSDRKNGHRFLYPLDTDPPLEKVRLARASSTLTQAYQAVTLAQVEDFEVLLRTAQGFGPAEVAPDYGTLWLVVRGAVGIETKEGAGVRLEAGELTVVPKGTSYRLSAAESSLLLTLTRSESG